MKRSHSLVRSIAVSAACWLSVVASPAQDWLQWRGPAFDGSSPEAKGLSAKFGKGEGLSWSISLPGIGASTPVVAGDRVFLTSADAATRELLVLAYDRKTGKELWRHVVASGDRKDERSTYASPSPVTDGKHVWFFFGQGDLLAYTVEGKEVWRRNIQKDHGGFAFGWTFSSTPLLHDGRLYLQVLQRNVAVQGRGRTDGPNESYILAMDPATGKDLWRHVRPADAREESLEAFTSPVPHRHGDRTELLVTGGDCITGHDPATGRELWRWGTWNPGKIPHWRLVPSPVAGAGIVLACAPKGSPVYAFKLGQNGTLAEDGYAWKSTERELSSDVSTPLFYRGRFYVLNSDRRMLLCVEPATGKVVWQGELPGRTKYEASPTAGDGKIYAMSMAGDVAVLGAGDRFEVLHSAAMGDEGDREVRASI
ncbi:MAG: PQQ-binding-like beta-propeller repeat protein, partial [Verrucomicrobiales bacterium]|nr:PQQ-binding-like beta-propeller repeat protein [Verrucomicrobiales bacterium]